MANIKAKKSALVNGKTLIVTADMSKSTNFGYWRCADGTDINPFAFSNNRAGFQAFWERISCALEIHNLDEMIFGYESTGPYAEALVHFLRELGVHIVQINPMHTKRIKELSGNSPNKTDQKDPKVIADIIELGHALTVVIPEGPAAELRRLTQARQRSIKRYTAFSNQLQSLIAIIFPEFLQVMKGVTSVSAQYLLKHHPTPQQIVAYGLDNLTCTLRKVSRGKLRADRAQALYEAAQSSVGVIHGQASIVLEICEIVKALEASERFTDFLEQEMVNYLKEIPYSNSILSIKGIGKVTAAGIIGEVGDFRKFRTISEIMNLAGLDLYEISSGKHKGNRRISKRGRSVLRKLLYFAALNTVRKGGVMHQRYQMHLGKGMPKNKALIAVARKLLVIIFALVRHNSVYISDYSNVPLKLNEAA